MKESSFTGESVLVDTDWGVTDRSGVDALARRYADSFGLAAAPGRRNITLTCNRDLPDEEYRLEIRPDGIEVAACGQRGFLHALSTLTQLRDGPVLPAGAVRDYPRLPMRGFQLMFESVRQLTADEAAKLITSAAKLKLNTVLMEFGPRFPFERHPAVRSPSALTAQEVRGLVDRAAALGVEAIPLQQSLGHLNYLLRHDEYADIREENEHRDQMCPLNPRSFQVFTQLAEEILAFFPGPRFMHIGADETRRLGVCPRCREEAARTSLGDLYVSHTNKVCEWLNERGITPILWDDILCAHPHVLDRLHESAWLMYWDYWTTESPSPLVVARYNPGRRRGVVVYDARWETEWERELSDVTAETLKVFAQPIAMETDLGEEFLRVYGDYLGDGFPKYIRAFPYLEYYQDQMRRVIGGPTMSGNHSDWLSLPDFPRYGRNIMAFAERCIEARAEGLVTTAWYDYPPEILYFGLVATAHFTW